MNKKIEKKTLKIERKKLQQVKDKNYSVNTSYTATEINTEVIQKMRRVVAKKVMLFTQNICISIFM